MTEVALEIGVAQSSVSYCLDQLREDFKDPLFTKVGRNLEPTPFLKRRMPAILQVIAEMESLPKRLAFDPPSYTGRITLLANVSEQMPLLKSVADAFRREAPHASLRLLELGSRERMLEEFNRQRPACVITVPLAVYPPELLAQPLRRSDQRIYFDPAHRGPISSIDEYFAAEHAVLDFGGNAASTVESELGRKSVDRKIAIGVPNVAVLAEVIRGSDLICTMQSALAESTFRHLASCATPIELPEVQFDLVWHRRDETDPISRWLRGLILEQSKAA